MRAIRMLAVALLVAACAPGPVAGPAASRGEDASTAITGAPATSPLAEAAGAWAVFMPHFTLPPYPQRAAMEAVVREELAATSPRALEIPPQEFYDDRFVRELDESGFVRNLGGS